jgi:hypothetical protein
MSFNLNEAIAVLERTPAALRAMLGGLPQGYTDANEGPNTWSPFVVLGHLVHGEETDWIPRARLILEVGDREPFEPFDREAQFKRFADWSMEKLLETFALRRAASITTMKSWRLGPEDLQRKGRHPALGEVTLQQLLATWVAHDLGHIAQIARAMAKRHTEDVGPWKEHLPVLTRARLVRHSLSEGGSASDG